MIGGWLHGTRESKEFATTVYGRLTDQIIQQLVQYTTETLLLLSYLLIVLEPILIR